MKININMLLLVGMAILVILAISTVMNMGSETDAEGTSFLGSLWSSIFGADSENVDDPQEDDGPAFWETWDIPRLRVLGIGVIILLSALAGVIYQHFYGKHRKYPWVDENFDVAGVQIPKIALTYNHRRKTSFSGILGFLPYSRAKKKTDPPPINKEIKDTVRKALEFRITEVIDGGEEVRFDTLSKIVKIAARRITPRDLRHLSDKGLESLGVDSGDLQTSTLQQEVVAIAQITAAEIKSINDKAEAWGVPKKFVLKWSNVKAGIQRFVGLNPDEEETP